MPSSLLPATTRLTKWLSLLFEILARLRLELRLIPA
jgi:hypothetical protein